MKVGGNGQGQREPEAGQHGLRVMLCYLLVGKTSAQLLVTSRQFCSGFLLHDVLVLPVLEHQRNRISLGRVGHRPSVVPVSILTNCKRDSVWCLEPVFTVQNWVPSECKMPNGEIA